ncbi:hypothetical protein LR48_Vigan10g269000 [Vigna angularis]|uniref:Alpha-dioxygenase 1 n=1 Tax=Phaseolus angularis TaxID=3914 RepID=A0A0L9VPB3_PHAAN|nr:hypothetical protein LR48_Vigan10g269000 [Vigna angularis]
MWSEITDSIRNLFANVLHQFIHKDFHEAVAKMTIIDAFLFIIVHSIDKLGIWPRLPVFLGLLYLAIRRHLHQEYNLFNVGTTPTGIRFNPSDFPYRTADGKYNDPFNEVAGSQGTFFGRNMLPVDQKKKLLKPDPMVVATKLLARRTYKDTGKQFNVIAASWIQFMIHDWIDHLEDTKQIELSAPKEVAGQCPLKSFKFFKTKEIPTGFYEIKTGSSNIRTPWWDGSAVYGSNGEVLQKVRTFKDGKLNISKDGNLLHNENGTAVSGDIRNSWAGVSTLQSLFIQEHNAVCDSLKWEDLTDDNEAIQVLEEVYGDDVEELDLLVGLMAEKKIKGFAISETAFVIFLVMASRRLEADRFFTSNYNEETYTKKGLEWVNTTESLKDVIDRHYPEMTHKWLNSSSAFSVWDSLPNSPNHVPLYLRVPH